MTQYQVNCTAQEPRFVSNCVAHIVQVGANLLGSSSPSSRLSVAQVYAAIDRGDTFWTWSPSGAKWANVRKYRCNCGRATLRSTADGYWDNNLDNLPRCG